VHIQVRAVREPGLARRHGEAYEAYAARTGRFLPRSPGQRDAEVERARARERS